MKAKISFLMVYLLFAFFSDAIAENNGTHLPIKLRQPSNQRRSTTVGTQSGKRLSISFSNSAPLEGVTFEDTVLIAMNRDEKRNTAIIRGNFKRPGWRLFGATSQRTQFQLAENDGTFELELILDKRLSIAFTLSLLGPAGEERSRDYRIFPKKITTPDDKNRVVFVEAIISDRPPFTGSSFRVAPQLNVLILNAIDTNSGGEATFVSAINPGLSLELVPFKFNPTPIASFRIYKANFPPSGNKPLENNLPWLGNASGSLLWWPTKSRGFGIQTGITFTRQPFVLGKDLSTLMIQTIDLLQPEVSLIITLTHRYPLTTFLVLGGTYVIPKNTSNLALKSGWEGFAKIQITKDFSSPAPLGLSQLFATFGYNYRYHQTDLISQKTQEMTLLVGMGW